MDKNKFIYRLTKALNLQVSVQDIYDARNYYNAMFEEAGPTGEQVLIEQLGSPETIAQEIIAQNNERIASRQEKIHDEAKGWENWKLHRHSTLRGIRLFQDHLKLSRIEKSVPRTILLWLGLFLCVCLLALVGFLITGYGIKLYQAFSILNSYRVNVFVAYGSLYLYIGDIALLVLLGIMIIRHGCYAICTFALRLATTKKGGKA